MAKKAPSSKYTKPKKKSPNWFARHRKQTLTIGLTLILCAGGLYAYINNLPTQSITNLPILSAPTPTPEPDTPNPLNGMLYTAAEAEKFLNQRPMAVMIENHVEARPQAGLEQAEVIHEAMAEGGITRFMALYLSNAPDKITPIRSARLHFVDWAAEYDSIYAHWGGSNESLKFLRSNSRPKDLDQFIYGGAFYRDHSTGRSLEHTGATSIELLRQASQKAAWEAPASFDAWKFKDGPPAEQRPTSHSISLGLLGTYGYDARFDYQAESNTYLRSTGGQPHKDANGKQLAASSIVLLNQNVSSYTDEFGKPAVRVQTTGTGPAQVIQDGKVIQGKWSKANRNSRTKLTTAEGTPISITRGHTIWVISVPAGSPVSY